MDNKSLSNFELDEATRKRLSQYEALNGVIIKGARDSYGAKSVGGYSRASITRIIQSGSLSSKIEMSRYFFNRDGFYKRLLIHYSTFLTYSGVLVPEALGKHKISESALEKRYTDSLHYLENSNLNSLFQHIMLTTLLQGAYYGIKLEDDERLVVMDLPVEYSRSRLKNKLDQPIVEVSVLYFNSLYPAAYRESILETYPKEVIKTYREYVRGDITNPWVMLSAEESVYFNLYDTNTPMFLSVIPTTLDYDDAVTRQAEREIEEIKRIIVQKIPHTSDGSLIFEPVEAAEMHKGAVAALQGSNPNTSVMTTYGDVTAMNTKVNSDPASTNNIQKMKDNIYNTAGASSQIFSATGNMAMENSLKNDLSFTMTFADSLSTWITHIVNNKFGYNNLRFKYTILPVSHYNREDYVSQAMTMAAAGYSYIIPAVAFGYSQKDLVSLKDLENKLLKLDERLKPLQSSYTQSAKDDSGGRPNLKQEEKTDKTIQNETAAEVEKYRRTE